MPAGRPLKYKTPEELQKAIDKWFKSFEGEEGVYPTMSGLAYFLGFEDRMSLYDYKGREKFSYTIKRALTKIESLHEQNLFTGGATGSIFWLKNRDWNDGKQKDTEMEKYIKILADALQPLPKTEKGD